MDFLVTILYNGTFEAWKRYKAMKWIYLGLIIGSFVELLVTDLIRMGMLHMIIENQYIVPISAIFMTFVLGIYIHIKDAPLRKKIAWWEQLFKEMSFNQNERLPLFLYHEAISNCTSEIAFKTLIPLNVWEKHKEHIAMQINKKILTIRQDEKNNQIIKLIIENEPLTSRIEWDDCYSDVNDKLNIGISHLGTVGMDLKKHPHAFIAGETGSGKSNILKCMIHQAINKDYDVILIDFKRGVSFSEFSDYVDIHFDYKSTIEALRNMVDETNRRLDLFRENRVDNLDAYSAATGDYLRRKIIFIDEAAELLKVRDKEISNLIYDSLETLTRLSRAAGIHLIIGIQRPDATIVSGQIKNNVSFRVCGRFVDREPSQIMLNSDIASKLDNNKGRFIIKDNDLQEVQCFYYQDSARYVLYAEPKRVISRVTQAEITPLNETIPPPEPATIAIPKSEPMPSGFGFDFSDVAK